MLCHSLFTSQPLLAVSARFEWFMALRYLWGAEGQAEGRSFLRFITYVAIGGIALGVGALLLALSIVRGFSQEIENKIVGFGAHVQVRSYLQDAPLEPADELEARLRGVPNVSRVAPVAQRFILLRRSREAIDGVALFGADEPPPYLADRVVDGAFRFAPDSLRRPGLVLGHQLARRLDLSVGQTVTAFSINDPGETSAGLLQPRVKQFHVAGIYETSLATIDDLYVFTSLRTARELIGLPENAVSHYDLTVQPVSRADSVAAQIEREFGFPVGAQTIYERFQGLFAWVNLQQGIIPLVISVIVIVAAFNIVSTLLMMILEKTREIGVLESLGASGRMMRRLFLALGLLIGVVGTVIGEALALILALIQQRFQIIPLPAEAYYMKSAPVELSPLDFVIVASVALTLCALAAYVPARVASRIKPVEAIRFQ